MSKRNHRSRSGSMLLKFSNTSITSARASRAVSSNATNGANGGNPNTNQTQLKRRKFFNSSTELYHVLSLMLMNFCRQVTSHAYLRRRLLVYCTLTLIGGIAHDFVPSLPRAFLPSPSRTAIFNVVFVKLAWAWNLAFLIPLVALASHAFRGLAAVQLDTIEASIEAYHERRVKQLQQAMAAASTSATFNNQLTTNGLGPSTTSIPSSGPPPKTIVTLQSLSSQSSGATASMNAVEAYQKQILEEDDKANISAGKIFPKIKSAISMLFCSDLFRLVFVSFLYYFATSAFVYIGGSDTAGNITGKAVALPVKQTDNPQQPRKQQRTLDISGHTFILVFSNLMFLEECNIMAGWERLGDRLYDLSREYMNLEVESSLALGALLGTSGTGDRKLGSFPVSAAAEMNRRLFLAWSRFHGHTGTLRLLFAALTALSLLWDLMLLQTACHFHTLVEKVAALAVAVACWAFAYRLLFPLLNLEVKRPAQLLMNNSEEKGKTSSSSFLSSPSSSSTSSSTGSHPLFGGPSGR